MGVNGRAKGSRNELVLAKLFKEWWGHGEWARTPMSGGWATPGHRDGFRTHGDIITTALDFPFTVEAKKQEKWSLDALLHNEGCPVHAWYDQAVKGTPRDVMPLLVAARNLIPQVVIFEAARMQILLANLSSADPAIKARLDADPCHPWQLYPHMTFDRGVMNAVEGLPDFVILPLEYFFAIDPATFGRKLPMPDDKKPEQRPSVPEPVIPKCGKCRQPMTSCRCTDNVLKK